MALTEKTTHAEEMKAGLAQQFKGKSKIEGYLALLARQVQDVESALISIFVKMAKPYAEGVQLDIIGKLVGEPRGGRDDTAYRLAIDARILLNTSHGRIEDLIALMRATLGDVDVLIREWYPAAFEEIVTDTITPSPIAWTPSTQYEIDDKVSNFGCAYVAIVGGTSASSGGPSGRGANIEDNTVRWNYYQPGIGERTGIFVLSGKPAGVYGVVRYCEDVMPFGFDDDPEAYGFDEGAFAGAVDSM